MQFVNAIWLWGLTGLIIPIGIHLLSRKQGKVIRFGSIRHLDETSTRHFRAISLTTCRLTAILFIFLLVLLLAESSTTRKNTNAATKEDWNDPKYAPRLTF